MDVNFPPRLRIRELPTCPACGGVMTGTICERCDAEIVEAKPSEKICETR